MNKVIAAALTADDLSAIQELTQLRECEVIAVALDVGDGPSLRELHDAAIAAGAARCHALDVREEFARECIMPAVDADTWTDGVEEVNARAREFFMRKLAFVAALEGGARIAPASSWCRTAAAAPSTRPLDRSADVDIAFENGVPTTLNGITMSLVEVLDSLDTIGAAHGVDRPHGALRALQAAYRSLCRSARVPNGSALLKIFKGQITVVEQELAAL